jgi:hypothetical protein
MRENGKKLSIGHAFVKIGEVGLGRIRFREDAPRVNLVGSRCCRIGGVMAVPVRAAQTCSEEGVAATRWWDDGDDDGGDDGDNVDDGITTTFLLEVGRMKRISWMQKCKIQGPKVADVEEGDYW